MQELLIRLQVRRAELATTALQHPTERTEFEYGRVSGIYQGLTMAIEALQELQAEKEKDDE